jgi:hypothetical protein
MRSSNEMYERGVADAEQDEINLFYYQHYYYYRKGYDRARKRVQRTPQEEGKGSKGTPQRRLLLLAASLVIVVGVLGGIYWLSQPAGSPMLGGITAFSSDPTPTSTPPPPPTIVPRASIATPLTMPTAAPEPTAPILQPGAPAQVVNVGEAALLVRGQPGTNQPVQARFPEGTQVTIVEGPVEADGYTWWRIEADNVSGWSAAGNPETGTPWLQPQ